MLLLEIFDDVKLGSHICILLCGFGEVVGIRRHRGRRICTWVQTHSCQATKFRKFQLKQVGNTKANDKKTLRVQFLLLLCWRMHRKVISLELCSSLGEDYSNSE